METPAFCLMFLCPNPIPLKHRLDQQLVVRCRCLSASYLLLAAWDCWRGESSELCLSVAFQSSLFSGSKLVLLVFWFWFRHEKAQELPRQWKSLQFPYLNTTIWVTWLRNESMFSCILVLWSNSVYENQSNAKRQADNILLPHWAWKNTKTRKLSELPKGVVRNHECVYIVN